MAGSSEFAPDLVFETQTWPGIDRSGADVPDAEVDSLVGAAAGASLPEEPRRRPPAGCSALVGRIGRSGWTSISTGLVAQLVRARA